MSTEQTKKNPIRDKTYAFAIRAVHLYCYLSKQKEYVLSRQVLRSGTSIGSNVEEAIQGQSRKDFVSKLAIALKEAQETSYWIRLLRDTKFITAVQAKSLMDDLSEILRLLTSIIKTSKK